MKTFISIVVVLVTAAAAHAQSTEEACKALPNGGKVRIEIPGVVGPPACQACAPGVSIPANFVLGFSDRWRGTCELKNPQGGNSGLCKADTTCPPGTRRVAIDGVWSCQAPSTSREIDCPRITGGGSGPADRALKACADELRGADARLKQRERELRAAFGDDGSRAETEEEKAIGRVVVTSFAAVVVASMTVLEPIMTVTTGGDIVVTDRDVIARIGRMQDAVKAADAALNNAKSVVAAARRTVVDATQRDLNEVWRQAEACAEKLQKLGR